MTEFVIRRNVQRFREMLANATDEHDRRVILGKLAEAQAKLGVGGNGRSFPQSSGRSDMALDTANPFDDDSGPTAA